MPATFELSGETARIELSGALDFSSQDKLDEVIQQALGAASARQIDVDLARATFIDSSIIRALLTLRRVAGAQGTPLTLWNCNTQIREILAIGGFDQLFVLR